MPWTYTKAEIEALTDEDVKLAKARCIAARETREGVGTVDYMLAAVGTRVYGGVTMTLEAAKAGLLAALSKDNRIVEPDR